MGWDSAEKDPRNYNMCIWALNNMSMVTMVTACYLVLALRPLQKEFVLGDIQTMVIVWALSCVPHFSC